MDNNEEVFEEVDSVEAEESEILSLVKSLPTTEEDEEAAQVSPDELDESNIQFPDNVVNKKAYIAYLRFIAKPIFTTKKKVVTSAGYTIDLSTPPMNFNKKLVGLPPDEQERLNKAKEYYFKCFNISLKLRRKALKKGTAHIGYSKVNLDLKKGELIELFGKMFTVDEVHEIINKEWHLPITKQAVWAFRKQHNNTILRKIEEYKFSGIEDIRVVHKRSRLEELAWLYYNQKNRYKETRHKDDYRLLLTTLEQIRKETEGDSLTIKGSIDVAVEQEVNIHVQMEMKKTLNLKELILSKVAAKNGLNTMTLISSLENSFYSRLNTFIHGKPTEDTAAEFEDNYPSNKPYNFDKIRRLHETGQIQEAEVIEEELAEESVQAAVTLKDKMKQLVNSKKQSIEGRVGEVKKFEDTRGDHVPRGNPNLKTHGKPTKH